MTPTLSAVPSGRPTSMRCMSSTVRTAVVERHDEVYATQAGDGRRTTAFDRDDLYGSRGGEGMLPGDVALDWPRLPDDAEVSVPHVTMGQQLTAPDR